MCIRDRYLLFIFYTEVSTFALDSIVQKLLTVFMTLSHPLGGIYTEGVNGGMVSRSEKWGVDSTQESSSEFHCFRHLLWQNVILRWVYFLLSIV